jgi:hypothetical protein
MACDSLQSTALFVTTNNQLNKPQTEEAFIVTIEGGFDLLSYAVQETALPQLRTKGVEYTTISGLEQKRTGKVQPLQNLAVVLIEREGGSTSDMLQHIVKSNLNGKLKVRFYLGYGNVNGDLSNFRLHSTLTNAGFEIEEGMNASVEGAESVSKQSVTLYGNYLPCKKNDLHDSENALASNSLKDLPLE